MVLIQVTGQSLKLILHSVLFGTLLHFLYGWTQSILISPFSCINESTWEHMKLLFWPMLIFAIIQSFKFKDMSQFWYVKTSGMLLGLILIPIIYYCYNGIIGKSPDWINILIFFISDAFVYSFEYIKFKKHIGNFSLSKMVVLILVFFAISFVAFTFFTPKINIFKDPISGTYGIVK